MSTSHLSVVVVDHCAFRVGLTVSVLWIELRPVSHKEVHVKSLLFHFNHVYLQEHFQSLLHSTCPSPLALLASMCMPVLDTVSLSIYFS